MGGRNKMKSQIDKLKREYVHLDWWIKICQDKYDDPEMPNEARELYAQYRRESRAGQRGIVQQLWELEGICDK